MPWLDAPYRSKLAAVIMVSGSFTLLLRARLIYPILYENGPIQLHPYGVALTIAFVVGIGCASRRARAAAVDPQHVVSLAIVTVLATLIGARLTYVAVNYQEFAHDHWKIVNPYQGGVLRLSGLVMNGGLVVSTAACLGFLRWKRLPVLRTLDVLAPSVAIGECITRLGCFFNGCCYGTPTSMPWGMNFPAGSPAGDFQRMSLHPPCAIHPTQLYSSLYGLVIFCVLLTMERHCKRFPGFTVFWFLVLYSAARLVVEFFRHYHDQTGLWLGLTHNQHLCIVLFAASGGALVYLGSRQTATSVATKPPPAAGDDER